MVDSRKAISLKFITAIYLQLLLEAIGLPPVGNFVHFLDDLMFVLDFAPADV